MKRKEEKMMSPDALAADMSVSPEIRESIQHHREEIKDILDRKNRRLIVIAGPCSIHNIPAALQYADKIAALSGQVSDSMKIVMRCYFEKPRTTLGWKGLIYDPDMDGSGDIASGIRKARKLLIDIAAMGVATATELLDPSVAVYFEDLISWSSIGARTAESQMHRQMASSLDMPVGFKNSTDGNLQIAVNAICAAMAPHSYLGILHDGSCGIVRSQGNPYCHLVLRGGASGENYYPVCVKEAVRKLENTGLPSCIVVDCSHANSHSDPARQHLVFENVVQQKLSGTDSIVGVMLESNILPGKQKLEPGRMPDPRISVTDGCIGLEETEALILHAAQMLRNRVQTVPRIHRPQAAYLGPDGTFTHLAAQKIFHDDVEYLPMSGISAVFKAVESGVCDYGCVPVSNSSEGVINGTLDLLAATSLKIYAETSVSIQQCLLSAVPKEKISVIISHTQSLGQCRAYLEKNFPDIETIAVSSNARAAELSLNTPDSAVIGGAGLAEPYHLNILERSIEDDKDNSTRFLILSKTANNNFPHTKCCIWFIAKERFGALHDCLEPFKKAGVSLSMIESRPIRNGKSQYRFFVDIDEAFESPKVIAAMEELKELTLELHLLGSFPVFP